MCVRRWSRGAGFLFRLSGDNDGLFQNGKLFKTELVVSEWHGFPGVKVQMPSFRRSLEATLNPLIEAGFRLERVLEPKPTEKFKEADPKHYGQLWQQPSFLCLRATK